MVLISRWLGVAEAGLYFLAVSFALIFTRVALLGLDQLLVRDVAQSPARARVYFGNFLAMRVALALVALAGLALVVTRFLDYAPQTQRVVLLYGLTILPTAIINICQALFIARERMGYLAGVALFAGGVRVVAGLLALWLGLQLVGIVAALLLASVVEVGVHLAIVWRRFLRPSWRLDWAFCRRQLGVAFPFVFVGITYVLENQLDGVLLSVLKDERAVGVYGAAATVLAALLLMAYAFQKAIYPTMSRLYATSQRGLERLYAEAMRYLFLGALPIAVGGTLVAEPLIIALYGNEFREAAPVLQVLLWVAFLLFLHVPNARLMVIRNDQAWIARFLMAVLGINVALNLALIPRWGAWGAAVARLTSTGVLVLLSYGYLRRRMRAPVPFRMWLRPIVAVGLMAFVLILLRFWPVYVLIPLGAVVYLAALIGFGALSEDDLAFWRRVLGGTATLEVR